ncbi:hypothetical protein LCGC14_1314520, partial [marine sediment metagenome]
ASYHNFLGTSLNSGDVGIYRCQLGFEITFTFPWVEAGVEHG